MPAGRGPFPNGVMEQRESTKRRLAVIAMAVWIGVIIADYYVQFFMSRYWWDHAVPFLSKLSAVLK